MIDRSSSTARTSSRAFLHQTGLAAAVAHATSSPASETAKAPGGVSIIEFERSLKKMRAEHYAHPPIDILKDGFRPIGGKLGDFATARHNGRDHFFYIERRLQEGTPFYPGHENFFGHASTTDFFQWEVHRPVMLVRPGTWEEEHVWAPVILRHRRQFIMAYTGLNRYLCQNIGLASSRDVFKWKRWKTNPISPCKGAPWAYWREDDICSCRDPDLYRHGSRVWMPYTGNTKEGATCIALSSTSDFKKWKDHGPILIGPASGYEPKLTGGHPQGSFESCNLSFRNGRWILVFHAAIRDVGRGTWAVTSDRIDSFSMDDMWRFWADGACTEVVREHGTKSLLAGLAGGCIRFGEVDWAAPQPVARTITARETLRWWNQV